MPANRRSSSKSRMGSLILGRQSTRDSRGDFQDRPAEMTEFFQQLINGLSVGSMYALIAIGYTLVYGVLRFINFAHSEVFMVGAFAGMYLGRAIHTTSWLGGITVMLGAMAACAALGIFI